MRDVNPNSRGHLLAALDTNAQSVTGQPWLDSGLCRKLDEVCRSVLALEPTLAASHRVCLFSSSPTRQGDPDEIEEPDQ